MKRGVRLAAILLASLLVLASLAEWGALFDIRHDYASRKLLRDELPGALVALPWWSACDQEWSIVTTTEAIRLPGALLLLVLLSLARSTPAARGDQA